MNFPLTLSLGAASIPVHALLETAAFFTGFRYFLFLRRRQGDAYSPAGRMWVLIGAIFGALAGSRLVGALERPDELLAAKSAFWYVYANKTVLGGFLGGLAGVEGIKKVMGETRASGDLFVFPIILALVIGRLGCFSMGVYEETYGIQTDLPWGMNLGDGIPRHPVTLYEMLFLLLLWSALAAAKTRFPLEEGALFKLFMIGYLFFRLALDFIKPRYPVIAGLSTIQLAALCGLAYYYRYLLRPSALISNRQRAIGK